METRPLTVFREWILILLGDATASDLPVDGNRQDQVFLQTHDAYVVSFLSTLTKHLTWGGSPSASRLMKDVPPWWEYVAGSWGSLCGGGNL